jgi:hypothetical protein
MKNYSADIGCSDLSEPRIIRLVKLFSFILLTFTGCGADMRRNEPTLVLSSNKSLDDTSTCLIPVMNEASYHLTNDISKMLNTAPVVVNELRVMEPKKIYEIGPVNNGPRSNWYVVRLTALEPNRTRIEMLPSHDIGLPGYLTTEFQPALEHCAT